jgi:hypothetical protein
MADNEKGAGGRWSEGLRNAGEQMRNAGARMAENNRAINLRLIEQAEENAREAFQALRQAAEAKSISDVTEIQNRFLRERTQRGMDQMREIGELIARFGREAVAPVQSDKPDAAGGEAAAQKDGGASA